MIKYISELTLIVSIGIWQQLISVIFGYTWIGLIVFVITWAILWVMYDKLRAHKYVLELELKNKMYNNAVDYYNTLKGQYNTLFNTHSDLQKLSLRQDQLLKRIMNDKLQEIITNLQTNDTKTNTRTSKRKTTKNK